VVFVHRLYVIIPESSVHFQIQFCIFFANCSETEPKSLDNPTPILYIGSREKYRHGRQNDNQQRQTRTLMDLPKCGEVLALEILSKLGAFLEEELP